ncbi:MAG: hypothetical protein JWM05_1263 [Acidimicrobiales bacterium]|nr:hypothetical protein [Acidimicrobiales bacterium]
MALRASVSKRPSGTQSGAPAPRSRPSWDPRRREREHLDGGRGVENDVGQTSSAARAAIAVACMFLAGASCTDSSSRPSVRVERVHGVPLLVGATSGPGTALGNGFKVVPGSRLLGDPVSVYRSEEADGPDQDRGWRAMLVVTGDPREVLAGYAEQSRLVGVPVPTVLCYTDPPVTNCQGSSVSSTRTRQVSLDYSRSVGSTVRRPVSQLTLQYGDFVGGLKLPPGNYSQGGDPRKADLPLPSIAWPRLARAAEAYEPDARSAAQRTQDDRPALRVPKGARLVGPAGLAGTSGSVAVLRVDGDADEVLAGTLKEMGAEIHFPDVPSATPTSRLDGRATIVRSHWSDGDSYSVTLVKRSGRPTWLWIEHHLGD